MALQNSSFNLGALIFFIFFSGNELMAKNSDYKNKNRQFQSCGIILGKRHNCIRDATVENVALYVKKNEHSDEKIIRNGVLVRYNNAVATILVCHGFMTDKYDGGFFRRLFPRGYYNVMCFDFRAHGENSAGQTCTFGRDEAYDVLAAAHFLKQYPGLERKPLFVYGFSMGAVAAIEAQAKDRSLFDAMILDCPFDSSENIIKRSLENVKLSLFGYRFSLPGVGILQRYAFHPYIQSFVKFALKTFAHLDPKDIMIKLCPLFPVKSIQQVHVPSFFIHCKNDEKVSVDAIKAIFERSPALYKRLWLTDGRGHFDSFFYNPERYTEKVRTFLSNVLHRENDNNHQQKIMIDGDDE